MKRFIIAVALVLTAVMVAPAFANTNPFMDVPANHWAHDSIAQLASRGVISGYPDGSYKGTQPSTRYEMASIVGRALAAIDLEKASMQDVEMLKKLVVEFKDELDALGVKVAELDKRIAVIETDLGGWSMSGQLRFDAKFADEENSAYAADTTITGKREFDLNRYRFFIKKRIDENTSFTARLGGGDTNGNSSAKMVWERYFVTTKLPFDVDFSVGRMFWDWEDDLGLYADNDTWYGAYTRNALRFQKNWGMADFDIVLARNNDDGSYSLENADKSIEQFLVAAKIGFDINEKLMLGVLGYWHITDRETNVAGVETDTDLATYGVYAGYRFTPAIQLKGIYYQQEQGTTVAAAANTESDDDTAKAWKVILDLDQDLLKFTSVWLEYGQMDNNFVHSGVPYSGLGANLLENQPNNTKTATIYGIRAEQNWNDKWRTYQRYFEADFDTDGTANPSNWTFGVGYRLNSAVEFELAYDSIDFGGDSDSESLVQFRTYITF